jgi:2-aminoethylphosphonate-pyruvate transaminase
MKRPIVLLNPGPVTLTERVRSALVHQDICHREPEFAELLTDVRRRLARVYPEAQNGFEAVIVSGSGTCAVEAMLSSFAPSDGKTLVVSNGVYGERMAAMLETAGKSPVLVRSEWLEEIDLAEVERALVADAKISHVVVVHNETTSGRLNDLAPLGALCKDLERALLVDAVSSFGAEEIRFSDWNVHAVAATANKCLHGAPGISFVLARKDELADGTSHAGSLYLDLYRYHTEQAKGFSPFTTAVHVLFALQEALVEFEESGGADARRARYSALADRVRTSLSGLGVPTLIDRAALSSMISSFRVPSGCTYGELHDALKERGFVIYAGQGELVDSAFRIANMGDITDGDLDRLVAAFHEFLGAL